MEINKIIIIINLKNLHTFDPWQSEIPKPPPVTTVDI